jgi:hypothetical protein
VVCGRRVSGSPSLDSWLSEGHLARFVADLVDEGERIEPEERLRHPQRHAPVREWREVFAELGAVEGPL